MLPNSPSSDLSEDRAWLTGFRAGEAAALERVFRTYAPLVFQSIRGGASLANGTRVYMNNADEEDDVVQDTFIRLLSPQARARYDGLRPYGALVRTVARNALVDHLRKRGRLQDREKPMLADDVAAAPEDTPGHAPLAALLSKEEGEVADALMASFSDEERRLAGVRFEQGLSQRDAAEALGISRQTIRTLEGRLMQKARDFLKGRGW